MRYKELVRECYIIAKNGGTPYEEVLRMSPRERSYFLKFIDEEFKHAKEIMDKSRGGTKNSG